MATINKIQKPSISPEEGEKIANFLGDPALKNIQFYAGTKDEVPNRRYPYNETYLKAQDGKLDSN